MLVKGVDMTSRTITDIFLVKQKHAEFIYTQNSLILITQNFRIPTES